MNKNYIFIVALILVVIIGAYFFINNTAQNTNTKTVANNVADDNLNSQNQAQVQVQAQAQDKIKEFEMDSFYEMVDGKPKPQYSLKEINIKKGDNVRIVVNVTKGTHDFNIDEFNIHKVTPLNVPTIVEFTADKVGEFIYYCSMPGHRANGHWGTLKVTE